MRQKIYDIVECRDTTGDGKLNMDWYDLTMMVVIVISLIPLLFKQENTLFFWIDKVTAGIFIIDYILRWITADIRDQKNRPAYMSFLLHPFTIWALIDIISIIPSLTPMNAAFKAFKILRMFKTLRMLRTVKVIRVAKVARYSNSVGIILNVMRSSKSALLAVGSLALAYIFISALIIFNIEPDSFETFYDAIYWATVSLTTVGYGDIYPTSTIGRLVTMISSLFGIAIVALPAGIITAGYMTAIQEDKTDV